MQFPKPGGNNLGISVIFSRIMGFFQRNMFMTVFITAHILFAVFLGNLYALAPDERGYLITFNNIYSWSLTSSAQSGSGWIAAPTIFLWIAYLPAKILNIVGVPDYLAVRTLSILLAAVSLYLMKQILGQRPIGGKKLHGVILTTFFIPSVFLWTSVGLRESFIIAEIAIFLAGFNFFFQGNKKRGYFFLFLGSYGLASTKNYLWACLMMATILACIIFLFQGINHRKIVKLLVVILLLPTIAFASTSSVLALEFIFNGAITASGERSGDSITQVIVEVPEESAIGETKELITFHGDYTLIALRYHFIDNPNSSLAKISRIIHLDKKIESMWNKKITLGLVSKDKRVGTDTSSFNGHILEPGKIRNPLSLIRSAFVFLCGPFPFIGDPGIVVSISSLESPLWWAFYALVLFQFFRFRRVKFLKDPPILFTLIILAGMIIFSALVEVNLGTSFRHRSILLAPLIFLYVRLMQRAAEQGDKLEIST